MMGVLCRTRKEMKTILKGGNWQCGPYAGYLHISLPNWLFGMDGRAYPASFWRGDDERYDGLPLRWVAIMKAENKRKCEEIVTLLEEKEMG
jgi:hypothetical protein